METQISEVQTTEAQFDKELADLEYWLAKEREKVDAAELLLRQAKNKRQREDAELSLDMAMDDVETTQGEINELNRVRYRHLVWH